MQFFGSAWNWLSPGATCIWTNDQLMGALCLFHKFTQLNKQGKLNVFMSSLQEILLHVDFKIGRKDCLWDL